MSTQSPNFNLTIATTADTVNVVTQIASNFSTLDTVLSYVITSTGAMKPSVFLPVPQLSSPTITGSMTGVFSITASTGLFNTVTCTSGNVTFGYVGIGTYSLPTTLGTAGNVLSVITGSAQWATPSGSGAAINLGNLAIVAINTNMNSFTASAVTMSAVIATSGSLTGLTVFQATTGTFAGNVSITGTLTANAVNCTGGAGTFGSVGIGTYSMPPTLGATGQFMKVAGGTLGFGAPTSVYFKAYISGTVSINSAQTTIIFNAESYDTSSVYNTANGIFTCSASGYYQFGASVAGFGNLAATTGGIYFACADAKQLMPAVGSGFILGMSTGGIAVSVSTLLASGATMTCVVGLFGSLSTANNQFISTGVFWGYKIPDS